ncbi:hypothetical protein ATKI12_3645 [Kitasatospora sp. Ki12]
MGGEPGRGGPQPEEHPGCRAAVLSVPDQQRPQPGAGGQAAAEFGEQPVEAGRAVRRPLPEEFPVSLGLDGPQGGAQYVRLVAPMQFDQQELPYRAGSVGDPGRGRRRPDRCPGRRLAAVRASAALTAPGSSRLGGRAAGRQGSGAGAPDTSKVTGALEN